MKREGARRERNFAPPPTRTKERRVHAAAWQKGSLCRLKPAFPGSGVKLRPRSCFCALPIQFVFGTYKGTQNRQKFPDYQAFFELVRAMLGIIRAENRSFQPVAPPVWIKEFPPFSHSPPGSNRDFGIWAGIGGDSGDGQSHSITGVSITGADARSGPH